MAQLYRVAEGVVEPFEVMLLREVHEKALHSPFRSGLLIAVGSPHSPSSDVTCRTATKVLIARAAAVPSQSLADRPIKTRLKTSFATENASMALTTLQEEE